MNMKKLVSALLAALMLVGIGLCAIPKNAFALPRKDVTVPEGYPEYEYLALVDILEQVDANGVKNGYKLNPDYDPEKEYGAPYPMYADQAHLNSLGYARLGQCIAAAAELA